MQMKVNRAVQVTITSERHNKEDEELAQAVIGQFFKYIQEHYIYPIRGTGGVAPGHYRSFFEEEHRDTIERFFAEREIMT